MSEAPTDEQLENFVRAMLDGQARRHDVVIDAGVGARMVMATASRVVAHESNLRAQASNPAYLWAFSSARIRAVGLLQADSSVYGRSG